MNVSVTRSKTAQKNAEKNRRKATRAQMTDAERKMERNVTKMIISTILQKEEEMRRQNRMRLPMNYITEIVKKYQTALPMLTVKSLHNALNYERGKRKKNTVVIAGSPSTSISSMDDSSASFQATDVTETKSHDPTTEDPKIGRPKGTTIRSKREQELKKNACYNEVTVEVAKVREQGMKMSHDHFEELVSKVKKKLALPEELVIKRDTVDKRIQRKKLVIDVHESKGGSESPLSEVEPTFVEIILMMSTIKEPLTPPEIKDFINSAIHGTEYQKKLIEFKKRTKCKQNEGKLGKVGSRYVRGFLKRWENWIHSKKPQRFELDRGQWARYSNFSNMYDSIEKTLVENGVATKLHNPTWMNKDGQVVENRSEAYGRPCTIEITHPDMCIVMDEVGSNTSQKGDGHVGGKNYVCAKEYIPRLKASKKEKHFTVLGLTTFTGSPLMCVVIIQGKNRIPEVETGIDTAVEEHVGSYEDIDFMKKNKGPGKAFPGGPTCVFRGQEIPCLVRFSESGGMTGQILLDIFKTLDYFEVFKDDRKDGRTPFVLLDGHDTRFYLPFVQYINKPETKYAVSLGVPYGTSYWQVGDSSEQNGSYKMNVTIAKEKILAHRESNMISELGIMPTDIMVIVNQAWDNSFARVKTNKKAIAERGWYPYNRILLDHPDLRATMTEQQLKQEKLGILACDDCEDISELTMDSAIKETSYYSRHSTKPMPLNLSGAMGQHILTNIVREVDLQNARQRIENEKKEGVRVKTMLKDLKRITAAGIVRCGEYTIGKNIEDELIERAKKKKLEEDERRQRKEDREKNQLLQQQQRDEKKRARQEHRLERAEKQRRLLEEKEMKRKEQYLKRYNKAVEVIENKRRHTWKISDYRVVLMALKTKEDGPLPNKLEELSQCYDDWIERNMTLREIMTEQSQASSEVSGQNMVRGHDNNGIVESDSSNDGSDGMASSGVSGENSEQLSLVLL